MVAKRKPRKPKEYASGGAVIPPADNSGPDRIAEAFDAAKAAEGLQRTGDPRAEIAAYVDQMGVTGAKREFLIENPHLMTPQFSRSVAFNWQKAKSMGIEDDSPAMFDYLKNAAREDLERQQTDMAKHAAAMLTPKPHPEPPPAEEPDEPEPAPEPAPPRAQPRKGVPMTAPVSRNVPSYSGQRIDNPIALTAEEREVARTSMRWLPPHEAERQYAENKRKMLGLKERGEIQ